MNVFKELVLSIYDFKSYKELLKNKNSKVFLAGLVLMAFYFLLTVVVPFLSFQVKTGGIAKLINESIPDFELTNETLWVAEPYEFDNDGTYILIDTDPNSFFYDKGEIEGYISDYPQVLLADSEKVILKENGEVKRLYYSQLELNFSRDSLLGLVPYAYLITFAVMLIVFIFMTGTFFFGVLFVALISMLAASCMKYKLTFGQLYLLGIYARTLPILIKVVVSFLLFPNVMFLIGLIPFIFPIVLIFNFGLSVLYIVLAIRKMRVQELKKTLEFTSDPNDYYIN